MWRLLLKHRARRRVAFVLACLSLSLGRLTLALRENQQTTRSEDQHEQLIKDTINTNFTWDPPSWTEALYTEAPRLLLSKIWQPPPPEDGSAAAAGSQIPITVFTALSLQRIGQLDLLCKSWPGPLVAAVWLPVVLTSNSQPVSMEYYTQQLQQYELLQKSKQQRSKSRELQRRRRNQQQDSKTGSNSGKKGKKKRNNKGGGGGSSTSSKGKGNQDVLKSQLRLQQRQLERLQQVLQELQQMRAQQQLAGQQQLFNSAQAPQRSLKTASTLADAPSLARQQVEGAMEAVEALLQSVQRSRTLTPPMHFFRAQAAKMGATPVNTTSTINTMSASILKLVRRLLAAPASTSNASSTTPTISTGPKSTGTSKPLKSAFISRSTYLTARNQIYAHKSIHSQSKVSADSRTPFSGADLLGSLPACQLTVMLFVQVFRDPVAPLFLFPINTLRNYAALMARTPLVSMVDVDLTFNARFTSSILASPARVNDLVRDATSGSLLVPPAFEAPLCRQAQCRDGVAAGRIASFSTKSQLQALLDRGWIDSFHCSKGTHWLVDYKRWFNTMEPYEVRYARGAEPWYIGHKALVPWYDTRLKGYGFNKQLQVLYATGNMRMRVRVLPDAWLIHIPHHHTAVSHAFKAKGQVTTPAVAAAQPAMSNISVAALLVNTSIVQTRPVVGQHEVVSKVGNPNASNSSHCSGQACPPQQTAAGRNSLWQRLAASWEALVQAITTILRPTSPVSRAAARTLSSGTEGTPDLSGVAQIVRDSQANRKLQTADHIDADIMNAPHFWAAADLDGNVHDGATDDVDDAGHATRGLQSTEAALAHHQVHELLLTLYARMFSAYTWPLGKGLLTWDSNRMPEGEHPHVDDAMKRLAAQLPWWTNYTSRWHEGQPSAVRPPYLDPPALSAWPVEMVKQLKAKLEMCTTKTAPDTGRSSVTETPTTASMTAQQGTVGDKRSQ